MTYGGDIILGDHCTVNPYTILYGHGGLKAGNFVRIAAHCVVIPANHSFESTELPIGLQKATEKGIEIGDDVWIASGVQILDGVQIGQGAVIGAGAVVVKNIPAFSVNVGVPARTIKMRK
jgi:acetyltransferase-like isoleucine patch superfamily enzyme